MSNQVGTLLGLRENPVLMAKEAARDLALVTNTESHDVAIVFGSGWDPAAKQLGKPDTTLVATDLAGFLPPTVPGHSGRISSVTISKKKVLVFHGRKHLYEFPDDVTGMPAVMHYVRVAKEAGCEVFVHTNAVGGLIPTLKVGQLVVVRDHNDIVTGVSSPLRGSPAFLDCSAVHDEDLWLLCRKIDPKLTCGVIANVLGPHFETPAAAKFLRDSGCDLVGMSMIREAILAHHEKMRFLGLSLVTDAAGDPVTHDEVQAVVRRRAPALGRFLKRLVEQL